MKLQAVLIKHKQNSTVNSMSYQMQRRLRKPFRDQICIVPNCLLYENDWSNAAKGQEWRETDSSTWIKHSFTPHVMKEFLSCLKLLLGSENLFKHNLVSLKLYYLSASGPTQVMKISWSENDFSHQNAYLRYILTRMRSIGVVITLSTSQSTCEMFQICWIVFLYY